MREWLVTWFKAARAPFLVISFLPALLGGVVAAAHQPVHWGIFAACVIGVVMAHSAADFIDDYFDYKKGNLGNKAEQFHDSPLIDQKVTLNQVLIAIIICLAISLITGLYVFLQVGMPIVWMVLIGTFIVFFYTSPPVMLNYRGLGETAIFLAFGPMIITGVYIALTGRFDWEPLLVSLVPGIFTMVIVLVSNTFDFHDDVKSGKRTFAVRFGQPAAVRLMGISSVIAYLVIILGVVTKMIPVWTLLVLLTIPLALDTVRFTSHFDVETRYKAAMTRAITVSSIASILLLIAYGIVLLLK
ncbi:MAG: prenyltransferase [Leptolinea sp.]|jgi:1,4-dihydroxy-2-naphthoate octaprenyltransferase|nr:prenyltransferase [Leptolinea sp.]